MGCLLVIIMIRVDVRAGAKGAIAPVHFKKWQIAPVNFEYTQVKDKKKLLKKCTFKPLKVFGIIKNCFRI